MIMFLSSLVPNGRFKLLPGVHGNISRTPGQLRKEDIFQEYFCDVKYDVAGMYPPPFFF